MGAMTPWSVPPLSTSLEGIDARASGSSSAWKRSETEPALPRIAPTSNA